METQRKPGKSCKGFDDLEMSQSSELLGGSLHVLGSPLGCKIHTQIEVV